VVNQIGGARTCSLGRPCFSISEACEGAEGSKGPQKTKLKRAPDPQRAFTRRAVSRGRASVAWTPRRKSRRKSLRRSRSRRACSALHRSPRLSALPPVRLHAGRRPPAQALTAEQEQEARLRAKYGGAVPKKKSNGLLPVGRKVRSAPTVARRGRPACAAHRAHGRARQPGRQRNQGQPVLASGRALRRALKQADPTYFDSADWALSKARSRRRRRAWARAKRSGADAFRPHCAPAARRTQDARAARAHLHGAAGCRGGGGRSACGGAAVTAGAGAVRSAACLRTSFT